MIDWDAEIAHFIRFASCIPGVRLRRDGYSFRDNVAQKMWQAWEARARHGVPVDWRNEW